MFTPENTEPYHIAEELKEVIDSYQDFKVGFCYTNSDVMEQKTKELGVDIEFYSGWVIVGETLPVHHAWCVLEGNHLMDVSMSNLENEAMFEAVKLIKEMKNQGREPLDVRNFMVKHTRKKVRENPRTKSEDVVIGKVPQG